MVDLLIAIILLIICFFIGSGREKKHYKKIKERELSLYKDILISCGKNVNSPKIAKSYLVASSVVIGCDHFKSFLASLRNIFGGNVSAYESVLDRGRREAILRIREEARRHRANVVINLKIETIMLDPIGTSQNPKVCVTAYGTAIKYGN